MKNYGVILMVIILIGVGIGGWYYYATMNKQQHGYADLMKAFFDEAQKQFPIVSQEIEKLEQANITKKSEHKIITTEADEAASSAQTNSLQYLKTTLNSLKMVDTIIRHDITALKNMPAEELQRAVEVSIDAEILKEKGIMPDLQTDQGIIKEVSLAGNALAMVIFYSKFVKTKQEKQAVLDMLHVLFDKQVDPDDSYNKVVLVYLVQPEGEDFLRDFIVDLSLDKAAGFKDVVDALQAYRKSFKK